MVSINFMYDSLGLSKPLTAFQEVLRTLECLIEGGAERNGGLENSSKRNKQMHSFRH